MDYSIYLIWTPILTADFFRLSYLDTLIFVIEKGLMAGVTGQQGMSTPPRYLITHPADPGVRVSSFIYLTCTCNFYLCFETDYSLVP
jgi:hypothetical protein